MISLLLGVVDPITATVTIIGVISSSLAVVERAGMMLKQLKRGEGVSEADLAALEAEADTADEAWAKKIAELRATARRRAGTEEEPTEANTAPDNDPPTPPAPTPLFG